ncbi:MAG: TetR family transcriptional regulator [Nocardioides sp.]|nr:TetR family transcriptional regulator [Nocardioides sp.]
MARQDGRQVRWNEHNQQRRMQILQAACDVIETSPIGTDVHVQQIAEKAGLNRTVVYRHFADRGDLDRAIRSHILDGVVADLTPTISLEGSVNGIIRRIVQTYVDYVVEHPALHAYAVVDSAGSMDAGIDRIARSVAEVLEMAIGLLDAELDEAEEQLVDPLAHGLVGAVFGAVRRWATREPRQPGADRMADLLTMSIWNLLDGHARRLGVDIDPDLPLVELLALSQELDKPEDASA